MKPEDGSIDRFLTKPYEIDEENNLRMDRQTHRKSD
jgi:hypothetical protein